MDFGDIVVSLPFTWKYPTWGRKDGSMAGGKDAHEHPWIPYLDHVPVTLVQSDRVVQGARQCGLVHDQHVTR